MVYDMSGVLCSCSLDTSSRENIVPCIFPHESAKAELCERACHACCFLAGLSSRQSNLVQMYVEKHYPSPKITQLSIHITTYYFRK